MKHDKYIYLSGRILSPKFVLFLAEKLLRTKKDIHAEEVEMRFEKFWLNDGSFLTYHEFACTTI